MTPTELETTQPSALKKTMAAIVVAVAMGILGTFLFFDKAVGISAVLFAVPMLALISAASMQIKKIQYFSVLLLAAPLVFFAAMPAIRANIFLNVLNIFAVFGLFLLLARNLFGDAIERFGIADYILTPIILPARFLRSAFHAVSFASSHGKDISTSASKKVFVGILFALPILLFFGALFVSADAAFKSFIGNFGTFHVPDVIVGKIIFTSAIAVAVLGALAYIGNIPGRYIPMHAAPVMLPGDTAAEQNMADRKVEVVTFLSCIGLLFLLFLVFQIPYLFGGSINITDGAYTYAEYARKGFWELLIVAVATLLILLCADWYTKKYPVRFRWFTVPGLVIIGEVLVIIVSAFKRLMLYQSAYGMTTLRLYVLGFIVLLGIVFLILGSKIFFKKVHSFFAFGVFISIVLFLVSFNLLNPDRFIAQQNKHRFEQTGKLDAYYLSNMSADANEVKLEIYTKLSAEDQKQVRSALELQQQSLLSVKRQWQSYNLSKKNAQDRNESFLKSTPDID